MGFWQRIFRSRKSSVPAPFVPIVPSQTGNKMSYYRLLIGISKEAMPDLKITSKECQVCGRTFLLPSSHPSVVMRRDSELVLDVGGYCPQCNRYICDRHAKLVEDAKYDRDGKLAQFNVVNWLPGCRTCGSILDVNAIMVVHVDQSWM
jgi:hypothetical protein